MIYRDFQGIKLSGLGFGAMRLPVVGGDDSHIDKEQTFQMVDAAMAAGAAFLVSPGLNPETVKYCREKDYPIIPGVCTPSEVELALSLGLTYLKFFPAEAAGGVKMINAMAAPYTGVRFMPTGGIGTDNLADYLNCKVVFACGGSWMVPADKLVDGNFEAIERLTREAVALLK